MACKYPILIKNPQFNDPIRSSERRYTHLKVPCGKCIECNKRRSRSWIFRLEQELRTSASAFFVTLTYADENLTWCNSGAPTLNKTDLQNYWKRLRKAHKKRDNNKIKYFACREYGTITKRPHYHAIIYNAYSQDIIDTWEDGHVHVGNVTQDSIAYTTKYIMKENEDYQEQFRDDPTFIRERAYISKGLGKGYTDNEHIKKYHQENLEANYLQDSKGFKYAMPRYYRERLYTEEQKEQIKFITQKQIDEQEEITFKEEQEDPNHYKKLIQQQKYTDYLQEHRLKKKRKIL